jgi:hypothetical protein
MLLFTSIQLNAEEICTDSKRRISLLENQIRQLAHSKDVSTEIDQLNLLKGNCPLNSSPLDQFIHFDDSRWRLIGLKAELDKSKKDIEHLSKYRAVSKELEVYKSYALKLGVSPKKIAKILQNIENMEKRLPKESKIPVKLNRFEKQSIRRCTGSGHYRMVLCFFHC